MYQVIFMLPLKRFLILEHESDDLKNVSDKVEKQINEIYKHPSDN